MCMLLCNSSWTAHVITFNPKMAEMHNGIRSRNHSTYPKKIEVACHYIQSNKKTTEWKLSADVAKNTHEDTPRSNWSKDFLSFSYEAVFSSLSSPLALRTFAFSASIRRRDCTQRKSLVYAWIYRENQITNNSVQKQRKRVTACSDCSSSATAS